MPAEIAAAYQQTSYQRELDVVRDAAAAALVATHARDAADAAELLDALGLGDTVAAASTLLKIRRKDPRRD